MFTDQQILEVISAHLDEAREIECPVDAQTVTVTVIEALGNGIPLDGYVHHCCWSWTRKLVGKFFTKMAKDDIGQLYQRRLPGFEQAQQAYAVERDDRIFIVPTPALTNEEIEKIQHRLRAEGHAKLKHAEELDTVLAQRRAADNAA